ncbi:MAG: hypothetical protein KIC98_04680 [Clostridioides difficile]|nr:hypothetical protein [Clostridioides difficile]
MKEKTKKYWIKVFFLALYVMPAMFLMSKVKTTFSYTIFGIVTIVVFMIIDKIVDEKYNI